MKPISTTQAALTIITMIIASLCANAAMSAYRTLTSQGKGLSDAISGSIDAMAHPWPVSMQREDLIAGLMGMITVLLIALYIYASQHHYRYGEEHGSAHWADSTAMAPFTEPDPKRNMQFTQTEGLSIDTRATQRNLNVLAAGGSGAGKTRSYVLPNLRNANMSYAITDPKGEIHRETAEHLAAHGYDVKALNLIDMPQSAGFNPMAYINPNTPEPAILRLTENLVSNTTGENRNSSDGFWDRAERALLNALIAWVYFIEDNPDLTQVVDMLSGMEASEQDETKMSVIDAKMSAAKDMIDEINNGKATWIDEHMDPRELERIADGLSFAYAQYRTFLQGAGETKKSIIISLGVRLAPLHVRQVREILKGNDIDLHSIGQRPTAIYVMVPDTEITFNFLAAVFYQCLFETAIYDAEHSGGQLPVQLHCFLDEFANIGKIPNFTRLIATVRSRGISISIIIQAIAQLKAMYKDDWEVIVGNCDSLLFLGAGKGDWSTPEWISKLLGNETIDTRDISDSRGTSSSYSISVRQSKRELLTPDELGSEKFPTDRCIYMLRGVSPFLSHKINPNTPIRRPKSKLARHRS
jgi:type IV secretion system protein VirD4